MNKQMNALINVCLCCLLLECHQEMIEDQMGRHEGVLGSTVQCVCVCACVCVRVRVEACGRLCRHCWWKWSTGRQPCSVALKGWTFSLFPSSLLPPSSSLPPSLPSFFSSY